MPRARRRHVLRTSVAIALACCGYLWWTWEAGVVTGYGSAAGGGGGKGYGKRKGDVLGLVNMFIGTVNGGHAFPGATLPYGMAKAGPDCIGEAHGGFASDGSDISGFSHMHDSGTGGTISLGNFPIFPQFCPENNMTQCKFTKEQRRVGRGDYDASPGYFTITLADGIRGESTVTAHTALYRFTFPPNTTSAGNPYTPVISLDLNDLAATRAGNAYISVEPATGRISGGGTFLPSFGAGRYTLHFCADFASKGGGGEKEAVIWDQSGPLTKENLTMEVGGYVLAGAFAKFSNAKPKHPILARVGLSFISSEQACRNAEEEIPDFAFDRVRSAAETAWRKKLNVITTVPGGVDRDLEVIFWSGFYRTMISPQDYTGENPLWESKEPYFDSFYCIWDSFRSQHPFLTIVDPREQSRMVRALLDIYKFEGKLPDCRMSFCKGLTQGGSNADVVVADAYVKKLGGEIDWKLAYEAVLSDAEVEERFFDHWGRGGLDSWKNLGFIPIHDNDTVGMGLKTRSVSRTVEFAYCDFCISEMAKGMGMVKDAEKYVARSGNWRNVFRVDQNSSINGVDTGFKGFLQPKGADLEWDFQDPARCSPLFKMHTCYLDGSGGEFYEGSSWLYSFFTPHSMSTLIDLVGGARAFVSRLDYFHTSGLLYMGDEQAFLTVYLYHYAGRPGLSAQRVHSYIPREFNNSANGIPGNDDSGAMGSFVALSMMGLFPNAGQDVYLITPPFFQSWSVVSGETGKRAEVRCVDFDPQFRRIFIQSAKRDGKVWTRNWIGHDFFRDGGVLELVLGEAESEWGTKEEDLPPSVGWDK